MSAGEPVLVRQPILAFAGVASVLLAASAKLGGLAQTGESVGEISQRFEGDHRGGFGDFDICDREGRTLASFVDRWVLSVCPRAAWQAHTPDHIARELARVLADGRSEAEVLARLLPDADGEGWVEVEELELSSSAALAVHELVSERGWPGVRLSEEARGSGRWLLHWQPAVLLSRAARGTTTQPWTWTRSIADGLYDAIFGEPLPEQGDERMNERRKRRERIWSWLLPSQFSIVSEDVRPDGLVELRELFADERVEPLHLGLDCQRERVHPAGDFAVLGTWGHMGAEQGEGAPRGGMEELGAQLFAQSEWASLLAQPAEYRWRDDRVVRHAARPYFQSSRAPGAVPALVATIDVTLQSELRKVLGDVLEEHGAAMAQAIVLEVESGRVLAIDAVSRYSYGLFAPLQHLFTPGSTMKPVTMAVALEHHAVQPQELIDVRNGTYYVPGSSRIIREALGHPSGRVTATTCLAHSSNAGMVQIGLRVPQELYEPHMTGLGYERVPAVGFRGAQAGWVGSPMYERWRRAWTHASICFGHETATTLWQHAAALATIVRGGEYRELSIFAGVDRAGEWFPLESTPLSRVFREDTSAEVRRMMQVGAWEGTGKRIWRGDLSMGTKTGTVEKVAGEVCEHARGFAIERGRQLQPDDRHVVAHKTCYTSLICAFGSPPDGGEELMVLVCVEEPTEDKRFGSQVAGPAAVTLLESSLGVRRPGPESEEVEAGSLLSGFASSDLELDEGLALPWAESASQEQPAW